MLALLICLLFHMLPAYFLLALTLRPLKNLFIAYCSRSFIVVHAFSFKKVLKNTSRYFRQTQTFRLRDQIIIWGSLPKLILLKIISKHFIAIYHHSATIVSLLDPAKTASLTWGFWQDLKNHCYHPLIIEELSCRFSLKWFEIPLLDLKTCYF